jgi:hypothetical protein
VTNPEPKPLVSVAHPIAETFRPLRDEWGLYDPAQAGLEAVIRKLATMHEDEANSTATDSAPPASQRWLEPPPAC